FLFLTEKPIYCATRESFSPSRASNPSRLLPPQKWWFWVFRGGCCWLHERCQWRRDHGCCGGWPEESFMCLI
ncbi:hypothetical protein VIGAN_02215200, partial [Vigna angularis var. angularis]